MVRNLGTIEQFGVSGPTWEGSALDIRNMFFDSLKHARRSITISAFSMGHKNDDLEKFFEIIEKKLLGGKKVMIIVNDDDNFKKYSRGKLDHLSSRFPGYMTYRKLDPKRADGKNKLLHAKITIIDREFALIGSANISRSALEHNYEIMIKIKGGAVSDIDDLMIKLYRAMEDGENY